VYILDGGIEKWKGEGRELPKVFPTWEPSDFKVEMHKEYFIEYDEFKKMLAEEYGMARQLMKKAAPAAPASRRNRWR
jgi:3-mercaptopyruvate sulfurtransferase SseA